MHTGAIIVNSDVSGSFWGVSYVTGCGNNVIFLFFTILTILTMLCCFPGLGMADKSCSEHIAGTMGVH